jgi:hypothetical protein
MRNFQIVSDHTVYVDSFKDGELENVNNYDIKANVKALSPIEAIEEYFKNTLYYDFNKDYMQEDEEEKNENKVWYSVLVDEENTQATETQKKEWKRGKKTLYANYITLFVHEVVPVKI